MPLALSVVGCGHGHRSERSVIAAALQTSGWSGLFPAHVGQRKCVVHGGGPAPGTQYTATCRTSVRFISNGSARVSFTHVINQKPHTWVYSVSSSLRVRLLRDFGPGIAPEFEA